MSILYPVATPIGNLGDISPRAVETHKSVDFIAAEDTRVTRKLTTHFGIKTPIISCHDHTSDAKRREIVERLIAGENGALVTDAGMPCISDPGSVLVKKLLDEGYEYAVVPGPTAVTSAAALCGCENGFCFVGFLPEKNKDRQAVLDEVAHLRRNVVFYAAPHDV
ncbi:MAG: 16S rRNA (cytidine(1402)-2'-O)-methyltransferase, partial [Abditibacteriota bacterium]|nr:16S rRNA (cytidine(1402)-2'-O)-methyltransferase [Abditibacteriota bacterium]